MTELQTRALGAGAGPLSKQLTCKTTRQYLSCCVSGLQSVCNMYRILCVVAVALACLEAADSFGVGLGARAACRTPIASKVKPLNSTAPVHVF